MLENILLPIIIATIVGVILLILEYKTSWFANQISNRVKQQYLDPISVKKYGIVITSHDNETKVPVVTYSFTLRGDYAKAISDGVLQVFVRHDNEYWPASRLGAYRAENNKWWTEVGIGGGGPGPRLLVVAIIGEPTQELCENYWKLGDEDNKWSSLKAPSHDIIECDKVIVNRVE